ncbi:MAG TPA: protein-L-isoaspartate(D-aspartate) O-methyltransferase [Thermoanaerobaculia bacterium]|nr:protein-L-isoaspartate(D-aspartate) O-methyltransferase [Thermoanaerobaculia bacterium]
MPASTSRTESSPDPFEEARWKMVEKVSERGVDDLRVLAAMREVPRHRFVPEAVAAKAYGDHSLPIGFGQTISQPYVVGRMTQLLAVEPHHKVLEIGCGSGYQAAVLGRLARMVFTLERVSDLARRASSLLRSLGCDNVSVKALDGTYGLASNAPYDRILVAAGASEVPRPLLDQLAVGGRMIVPVGGEKVQRLRVIRKRRDHFGQEEKDEVTFVPLLGRFGRN